MSLLSGNWAQHWLKETLNLITENWKICWFSTWIIVSVIYTSLHEKTYNSPSCIDTAISFVWSPDGRKYENFTPYTWAIYAHRRMLPMFIHRRKNTNKITNWLISVVSYNHCPSLLLITTCNSIFFLWLLEKNMLQDCNIWVNSSALGVK